MAKIIRFPGVASPLRSEVTAFRDLQSHIQNLQAIERVQGRRVLDQAVQAVEDGLAEVTDAGYETEGFLTIRLRVG